MIEELDGDAAAADEALRVAAERKATAEAERAGAEAAVGAAVAEETRAREIATVLGSRATGRSSGSVSARAGGAGGARRRDGFDDRPVETRGRGAAAAGGIPPAETT